MFGLHQCSHPRVWTPREQRLFQEIGRRLADALDTLLMFRDLRQAHQMVETSRRDHSDRFSWSARREVG
jgi:GAF domain-containing protein